VKHHVFSSNLLVICSICSKKAAVRFSNQLFSRNILTKYYVKISTLLMKTLTQHTRKPLTS
jgi:hypothetical protein